jgi:hypothetical protein
VCAAKLCETWFFIIIVVIIIIAILICLVKKSLFLSPFSFLRPFKRQIMFQIHRFFFRGNRIFYVPMKNEHYFQRRKTTKISNYGDTRSENDE